MIVRVRSAGSGAIELLPDDGDSRALRRRLLTLRDLRVTGRRIVAGERAAAELLGRPVGGDVEFRWDPEAEEAVRNRISSRAAWRSSVELRDRLRRGGVAAAEPLVAGCRLRPILDDHQVVDVALMTAPGGYGACIFDEQGTGKTVGVIAAFDLLVDRGEARQLLIVAPKSMLAEWRNDFERFMGDTYRVVVLTSDSRDSHWLDADVVVVNYEAAVSREAALTALARRSQGRTVLAVDESYHAKNRDAARSRALARIREWCGRSFVLCGTPAPNVPADVIHQFDLVDFGLTFKGISVPDDPVAAARVVGEAMEARGVFIRSLKASVLPDLPPKRYTSVFVEFAPAQRRAYEAALDGLIVDLQATDDAAFMRNLATFMARRSTLLQLCSNPRGVLPGYDEVPAKLRALDEIVASEVVARREKLVIWSFYRHSLDAICDRYGHLGLVRIDGSVTSIDARRDAVRRFQDDDDVRIFVGNPAAAGAGITLHRARLAVFESLSNQAAHFLQSVDRIHRRGQRRNVELLILICEGSVEVTEYGRIEAKTTTQRMLLRDADELPVNRQRLMDELVASRDLLRRPPVA